MDTSVALVQAYLQVNGYFTVAEYSVMSVDRGDTARAVTDLDILAVRFPGAGHELARARGQRPKENHQWIVDPALRCPSDRPDMIVGEVKEGKARFNPAMRTPGVLEVALSRFGCCPPERAREVTHELLARGEVVIPGGHSIRVAAFGATTAGGVNRLGIMLSMRHVVQYLQGYLREHWAILRHAQFKEPTISVLALLQKWGVERPLPDQRRPMT